jgi:hypothetical protein
MGRKAALHVCWICGHPVPLEECKTDEQGRAVHEQCYAIKIKRETEASSATSKCEFLAET